MASVMAGTGTGSASAFDLYVQQQVDLKQVTPRQLLANRNYTAAHARGKLTQVGRSVVDNVINEGGRGDFYKLRVTGALTMIDSLLFLAKAKELAGAEGKEGVRRAALEFGAASLVTTAAALEIGSLMQEWLVAKTGSGAAKAKAMADIRLSGFKLAGNALAGVAGVVGAYYDFKDGAKAQNEQKVALMWAFRTRGVSNGLAIGTGLAMGFSYSGPLLEHWTKGAGGNVALEGLASSARWLATRRAWLFAATWWITFVTIAFSFVIARLSGDAMEKWAKRSSFRRSGRPEAIPEPMYTKGGEELAELYNAFAGVST